MTWWEAAILYGVGWFLVLGMYKLLTRTQPLFTSVKYHVQIEMRMKDDDTVFEFLKKTLELPVLPRIGDTINISDDRSFKVSGVYYGENQLPSITLGYPPVNDVAYHKIVQELRDNGWR